MEIETTQRIEGWPPFTKIVRVEHFGDPEETAAKWIGILAKLPTEEGAGLLTKT
ncbi:MAG TPA: hypothetical protein VFO40_03785 [Chthoniobacterales bacterium]|nr:hypothetical protein [Chthoniobacterales bacterium]